MHKARRLLLLASGGGSLAKALMDEFPSEYFVGLISDKDSPALELARSHNVPDFYLPIDGDRAQWNSKLFSLAQSLEPDLVISVGFMRILDKNFVSHFKVINTHPALLPLFPGAHAVRDALRAGATETGTTVHWVDEGMDTGEVISQVPVAVFPGDDEASLHERIKVVERQLIVETVRRFVEGSHELI